MVGTTVSFKDPDSSNVKVYGTVIMQYRGFEHLAIQTFVNEQPMYAETVCSVDRLIVESNKGEMYDIPVSELTGIRGYKLKRI